MPKDKKVIKDNYMSSDTSRVALCLYSIFIGAFVVLLVLKLFGTISWSWWWVTAPLWITLILCLILWAIVRYVETLPTDEDLCCRQYPSENSELLNQGNSSNPGVRVPDDAGKSG